MLTIVLLAVSHIAAFVAGAFTHKYMSQKVIAAAAEVTKVVQ